MKFQCDRCKTRYSIADEKVRGKILKIRCKTCEAVITVREEASPPARLAPEAAAVGTPPKGRVLKRPSKTIELSTLSPSGQMVPQPDVGAPVKEWFIAVDGAQEGPLSV